MSHELDRFNRWGESDEPKLVSSVTDQRHHRHIYIYYRRNAYDTIRRIHRHVADGRLTFDEARSLQRQVTEACGLAG